MDDRGAQAIAFYARHPISYEIISARLRASRGSLEAVRPEELFPHDQDHYGGLEANDALARCAGLTDGMRVADFCAGLGGPARYFAHRYGAEVVGIELTPARVEGARRLTELVGLQHRVRIIEGNVLAAPLDDGSMDVVVSQEALLHVPDKQKALREAHRVLRPDGRMAFTDWVVHKPLASADAELMWQGMAAQSLLTLEEYCAAAERAGFRIVSIDDLTVPWAAILAQRLRMYRRLRSEAHAAGAPEGDESFYRSYVRLVALIEEATLGGVRMALKR